MANVMQQRGNDQALWSTFLLRKPCRLQAMPGHRHTLTEVGAVALVPIDPEDVIGNGHFAKIARQIARRRPSLLAATIDARPMISE